MSVGRWPAEQTVTVPVSAPCKTCGGTGFHGRVGVYEILRVTPAIAAMIGWTIYGETLSAADWIGAIAIALALVLVRLPQRGLRAAATRPS